MSLSKRTHIMLDPRMFDWLKQQAEREQRTIGSYVRLLLDQQFQSYQSKQATLRNTRRENYQIFWQTIQPLRKKNQQSGVIDYKELINVGKK